MIIFLLGGGYVVCGWLVVGEGDEVIEDWGKGIDCCWCGEVCGVMGCWGDDFVGYC